MRTRFGGNQPAQRDQRDHVRDHHDVVEHIRQLPYQIVGEQRSEEDKRDRDHGVDQVGFLAKKVIHVDASEQIPADDRGKREEQKADGDKAAARAASEYAAECQLRHVRLVYDVCRAGRQNAVACVQRGNDHQRGDRQHDKRIDEYADHRDHALIVRRFDVRHRVCVRGRAHTGFIGEQAALCALADRLLDRKADRAADDGVGLEGVFEDHAEGFRNVFRADYQHDDAADEVQRRHDGYQLFGDCTDALQTADEDQRRQQRYDQSRRPCGNTEGGIACGADGIGLHHAAHEAQRQNDGDREETGEERAEFALEGGLDIVNRTARDAAVRVHYAGLLRQHGFRVNGRHAEECDDPHPEDRAGAADQNRAARADDVARANLRGDGGGQRLKGAETALLLSAVHVQIAEYLAHAFAEAANLHKARPDGEIQSGADQQNDQNVIG